MDSGRSLYDEALDRFTTGAKNRYSGTKGLDLLHEFLRERASPEETKQAAELLQADAGKKYGGRKVGDVEIPASWIANIMNNINNFVAAGDFVTKSAPESVGMAWYAVKLTLTAIHSNYDLYTFFGSGLSDISEIMILVRHYDRLYDERSEPNWKPSPVVEKLFQDVIGAYEAVLDFSFAIKRHLTAGALTRIKHGFKDFFGMSKVKFEDNLNTVAALKKKILEESQAAFQDKTLTQLQDVTALLAGIEGTVRHLSDLQEIQHKLRDEANAKFDLMLKGLDDIKASTKRKSQWDYAVGDFQAYHDALSPLEGSFRILGDTIDAIYAGTCQWVFDERVYREWVDSDNNAMLCVTGPEGCGKSYIVAAIADRFTQDADSDRALFYVSCNASAGSSAGLSNSQSYTSDSICRTFLSQLYELAPQGEENVGLLVACNNVFKKAKAKNLSLPIHMRDGNTGLPEFTDGFTRLASLLKKNIVLVLDGLDKSSVDDRDQEALLRKFRGLLGAVSEMGGIRLDILVGCGSSTKFFNDLALDPGTYIDVGLGNWDDMQLVITDALRDIPGLTAAEQQEAKDAILAKASSSFVYVWDTAIPFMREPFQRPLSKRLEALPNGTNDAYAKALRNMSPNYIELLRTAVTWCLLSPGFPWCPFAREVMDAFHGTYDITPDPDTLKEAGEEPGFPAISPLELEQLRAATDPFLTVFRAGDRDHWVFEADHEAAVAFFCKETDTPWEEGIEEHLCARCKSSTTAPKITVDPKQGHLQMALTCLRHLNNPLFQKRSGYIAIDKKDTETAAYNIIDFEPSESDAREETQCERLETNDPDARTMNPGRLDLDIDYLTEDSVDDEDIAESRSLQPENAASGFIDESDDEEGRRLRYELQYWPYHIREAEKLWSSEERKTNSNWVALMKELDKFAFETPNIFAAWQFRFPAPGKHTAFRLRDGPHKPLHVAAYLGLTSWTEHLLDQGEDLNGLSAGFSPLQTAACREDRLKLIKLLLDKGADVNAENGAGRSAFYLWLLNGECNIDGVQMMLEHNADPRKSCPKDHYYALHYFATRGEDPAVLDLLIAHGADINAIDPSDPSKLSPLHVLLMRREVPGPLLEAFIKHKADINAENAASIRPLQAVCTYGEVEHLKILLSSEVLEIDDPDLEGTTALHEAVASDHSGCVRVLLEHGANPDVANMLGRGALHIAARNGTTDCVRLLLEHSKQVNHLDKHGWSPFYCACISKNEEAASAILNALIEHKVPLADINKPTRNGRTALRQAADHGFDGVVAKLIKLAEERKDEASLAINATDAKKSMTALHRAAMHGYAATVRALLAANPKPNVNLLDYQEHTALALAYEQWAITRQKSSYEETVSLLIDADPSGAAADANLVAVCAANGSTKLLKQLAPLGADLSRPDRFGWTPLELAHHFAQQEAESFLKQQAAWSNLLPTKWSTKFPATTPVGAQSVLPNGQTLLHTSGRRVCVSADKPLPAGLERYYFEVTLTEIPEGAARRAAQANTRADKPQFSEIAVGFCTLGGAAIVFPGWFPFQDNLSGAESWAYHADTGNCYESCTEVEEEIFDELRYGVGDTVGAGVDLDKGEIWFTRNGVVLEKRFKSVTGRLFPVVGLHDPVMVETNFGGHWGS